MDKLRARTIFIDDHKKDIIEVEVELSNVLPQNGSSVEVQYESALVISHDGMTDDVYAESETKYESESDRDESAIEVILCAETEFKLQV